jgi:DNA-binding transcriptional MerR regulator
MLTRTSSVLNYYGMTQLLTVSEVVDCCAPPNDELRTTWLRRLRDWSNIGLLEISGRHREGTGRHRLYSLDAVYVAAVLLRMADLGVPVSYLARIARLIQRPTRTKPEQEFRRFWAEAKKVDREEDAYFAIKPEPRGVRTFYKNGWGPLAIDDDAAWVTIKLTAVFCRLDLP